MSLMTLYILIMIFNSNPLNAKLNPTCHLLAKLGAHPIFHVSSITVNINVRILNRYSTYCSADGSTQRCWYLLSELYTGPGDGLWNIPKHVACASDRVRLNFSCFLSTALTQQDVFCQDGLQTAVLAMGGELWTAAVALSTTAVSRSDAAFVCQLHIANLTYVRASVLFPPVHNNSSLSQTAVLQLHHIILQSLITTKQRNAKT